MLADRVLHLDPAADRGRGRPAAQLRAAPGWCGGILTVAVLLSTVLSGRRTA